MPVDQSQNNQFPTLEDFEALLAEVQTDQQEIKENEIVSGRVLEVRDDYVLVDIGYKSEGRIDLSEFKNLQGELSVEEGQVIVVLV